MTEMAPIQFPWVMAKATPRIGYRERLMWCAPWGVMQGVWMSRRQAISAAVNESIFNDTGCFYRAVPMPITGSM